MLRPVAFSLLFSAVLYIGCQSKSTVETSGNALSPATADTTVAIFEENSIPLYVHAGTGVVLRAAPTPDGETIETLPYGARVEATSLETTGDSYLAESIPPYQIAGKWLKVKTAAGKDGYVFERYLFPFLTHKEDYAELSYLEWFYRQFSPQASISSTTSDSTTFQEGAIGGRTTFFNDGAQYEFVEYEGGVSEFLRIPVGKITMENALVIFRAAHFRDEEHITTSYDEDFQSIFVNGEISSVQIRRVEGFIEIAFHVT